jgi:hypothetical protein
MKLGLSALGKPGTRWRVVSVYPQSQLTHPPFLPRMLLIIAAAQPTPAETSIAFVAQFIRQAPHSMQSSRLAITAFRSMTANTACGQTSSQRPQPGPASDHSEDSASCSL